LYDLERGLREKKCSGYRKDVNNRADLESRGTRKKEKGRVWKKFETDCQE